MLALLESIYLSGALILYIIITDFWSYKVWSQNQDCSYDSSVEDTFEPVYTNYEIESVFLDAKESLPFVEEVPLYSETESFNTSRKNFDSTIVYSKSILNEEQNSFFDELFSSINDSVNTVLPSQPNLVDLPNYVVDQEDFAEMLSMNAWNSEPEPLEELQQLAINGTSKINEHLLGEQQWVVEVIGEEQGYLHVSDGSARAWINFNAYNGLVNRKDKLSIRVNRLSDVQVELIHAEMLQQHSMDFCLTDELDVIVSEEHEAIGA